MLRILKLLNSLGFILVLTMSTSYALPPGFCKTGNTGKLDNTTIEFFANFTINSLFTFNFVNYKDQLSSNMDLVSASAWTQYNNYLNSLELIKEVVNQKLIAAAYFRVNAQVLSETNNSWQVNVPFILNTQSASSQNSRTINATMTIEQNNKHPINCGLQVTAIQFNPEIKTSFFKRLFESNVLSYQDNVPSAMKDDSDLKQPLMSDTALITAANEWILKQNLNPSLLNGPLVILQKGILQDKYAWKIKLNNATLLVTRSADSPSGLDFKMSN